MLAAAGLSATWVFRKARVLAICDDLDTVLLMIPLKMAMVGVRWQLALIVLLWLAWRYLHAIRLPTSWSWVLGYALTIAGASEAIYHFRTYPRTGFRSEPRASASGFLVGKRRTAPSRSRL